MLGRGSGTCGRTRNFWSDEVWALFGLEPHSCRPSYEAWRLAIHPDDRADAERAVQEAASKGTELNTEWRSNDGNGSARWLMSRGRPVRDGAGKVMRYTGIVMDITDRKKIEVPCETVNRGIGRFSTLHRSASTW